MSNKTPESKFVADARARTGLMQKEFAPLIHTTAHMVSQYETGKRQPSKRVLAQIQRVLIERGMANEPCSPIEGDLLQMYRELSAEFQEQIVSIVRCFTLAQRVKPKRKTKSS